MRYSQDELSAMATAFMGGYTNGDERCQMLILVMSAITGLTAPAVLANIKGLING